MTAAEISPASLPEETIVVIPRSLDYHYDHDPRVGDVIQIVLDDKRVGPVAVVLTATMATHIAAHLTGMLNQLDELRQQHNEGNAP
ncbi:MAG: hypothetical protein QOJ80_1411 [Mycobacterium sp.]|jgi:hypothetical protein|nr:hypothetical protein [Mycobacterium sp.]